MGPTSSTGPTGHPEAILALSLSLVSAAGCTSLAGGGGGGGEAALRKDVAALRQGTAKQEVKDKLGNPWDANVASTRHGQRAQRIYRKARTSGCQLHVYFESGEPAGKQY